MAELTTHWTERSVEDYVFTIAADFALFMEKQNLTNEQLAEILGVTPGRVSQVLNDPGNMRLLTIVKYARALGKKISLVIYDDGDSENERGPIPSEIFARCWERAGKPKSHYEIAPEYVLTIRPERLEQSTKYRAQSEHFEILVTGAKDATLPPRLTRSTGD